MDPSSAGRGRAHLWIRHNILGLVAIFIALSGSAVAANVATQPGAHAAKKKAKVKRGPPGPAGPAGPAGAPGTDQAPRSFALISYAGNADNVVREAGASVITDANVHRQAPGLYCIYGLPFTPRHAQVTLDVVNSGANDEAYVYVTPAEATETGDCPGLEQVEVFIDDNNDPVGSFAGTDVPFYLSID